MIHSIANWLRQDHLEWNLWVALVVAIAIVLFLLFVTITGRKIKHAKHMGAGYDIALDLLTDRVNAEQERVKYYQAGLQRVVAKLNDWVALFGSDPTIYKIDDKKWSDCEEFNHRAIAVDLDGVILEYDNVWRGSDCFGEVMPGAVEGLKKLKEMGFTIIVYTTRNNCMIPGKDYDAAELTNMVKTLLDATGVPYDYISPFKPLAAYYLDDRGVRFTDWKKAIKDIKALEAKRG